MTYNFLRLPVLKFNISKNSETQKTVSVFKFITAFNYYYPVFQIYKHMRLSLKYTYNV